MSATAISRLERYLLTIQGRETDRPPIWIMRQAGRYMPEYMALRSQYSFRDFCLNPEVSAHATLLPLQMLDVDVLIIFNDILIPLEAMGLQVEFPEGGPRIVNPVRSTEDLDRFHAATFQAPAVARSIRLVHERAGAEVPVLGFCGAPFTLAAYAVEGRMSRNHHQIMRVIHEDPALAHEILARIADTAADYLIAQVRDGGADGVQIFESWASLLAMPHHYEEFAAAWQRRVIERFRRACPDTPVHLYARGTAGKVASMEQTGADVLSIDWSLSLAEARKQTNRTLQGNLDPLVLVSEPAVDRAVEKMLEGFDGRRGWIANLGHGITPEANVAAARRMVEAVRIRFARNG